MLSTAIKSIISVILLSISVSAQATQDMYDCGEFLAIEADFDAGYLAIALKQDLIPSLGARVPAGYYPLTLDWQQEGYSLYSLDISGWMGKDYKGTTLASVAHDKRRGFETIDVLQYTSKNRPPNSLFYKLLSCKKASCQ